MFHPSATKRLTALCSVGLYPSFMCEKEKLSPKPFVLRNRSLMTWVRLDCTGLDYVGVRGELDCAH